MQTADWAPEQYWRLNLKLEHYRQPRSLDLEVAGGFLASIRDDLIVDLLTLVEGAEAGAFDCRDMNEHVLAAASRLNKTIAFGRIEPVPTANSIWLASNAESGDASAQ